MSDSIQNTNAGDNRTLWIVGAVAFAGIGSFLVYSFIVNKNINSTKK